MRVMNGIIIMCEVSCEAGFSEYSQVVEMCMIICHHNSSRRADDIALRALNHLVNEASEDVMLHTSDKVFAMLRPEMSSVDA